MKRLTIFLSRVSPFAVLFIFFTGPQLLLRQGFILGDYAMQHLPWALHTFEAARRGSLPFWTDAMALGFPLFAEGQSASLYFIHWVGYRLLPFQAVYSWSVPLHLLAGGAGILMYTRKLSLSREASVIAAICFCFSSAYAGCFYNTGSLRVLCWLPLQLWMMEVLAKPSSPRPRAGAFLGLCFIVCQQWLGGFPQMAVYAFLYLVLHELLAGRAKSFAALFVALAAGTAAAWPQISATLELIGQSVRSGESVAFALWGSVPPAGLVSLFFPEWGNALRVSFYLGILPLFLAAAPFFFERTKVANRQAWLAGLFFLLALGRFNPAYAWAVEVFHLTSMRNPAKFLFFVSLPLGIMAAYGYDALLRTQRTGIQGKNFIRFSIALAAVIAVLPMAGKTALSAFSRGWPRFSEWYVARLIVEKGAVAKEPSYYFSQMESFFRSLDALFSYQNLFNLESILLALACAAVIAFYFAGKIRPNRFYLLICFLLVWDLGVFGSRMGVGFTGNSGEWSSLAPSSGAQRVLDRVKESPGVIAELVNEPSNEFFYPNSSMTHHLSHAGGYSPLLLAHYYGLVRDLGIVDSSLGRAPLSEEVWKEQRGVVDLLGARYLHTDFPIQWPGLELIETAQDSFFYENRQALPPVVFYSQWRVIEDERERLSFMKSRDFQPSEEAVLSAALPAEKNPAPFKGSPGSFKFLDEDHPGDLRFHAQMRQGGIAMPLFTAYPGWSLEVDGKPCAWTVVNHSFLGFYLEEGGHEVRLSYKPSSWALSRGISWIGLAISFMGACVLWRKRLII